MWTQQQREGARQRALARWANPEYKLSQGNSIKKSPKCPTCGEINIDKFYVDASGRRTNKYCKECHKAKCKERWHALSPVDKQATRVKAMYGITSEEYKALHTAQKGKCAICGTAPTTKRGLHVDHCHETGKVRGLLCHGCNTALGSFKDNTNLLNNAINYLKR